MQETYIFSECLLHLGVLRVLVLFCVFVFVRPFVMVPFHLTVLHCLQQSFFEHDTSIYIMSCPPFCPLSVLYLCVMIGWHMWPQTLPCVFKCMISVKPVFYMPLITYTVVRKCFHLCSAFFGFWHDMTY